MHIKDHVNNIGSLKDFYSFLEIAHSRVGCFGSSYVIAPRLEGDITICEIAQKANEVLTKFVLSKGNLSETCVNMGLSICSKVHFLEKNADEVAKRANFITKFFYFFL